MMEREKVGAWSDNENRIGARSARKSWSGGVSSSIAAASKDGVSTYRYLSNKRNHSPSCHEQDISVSNCLNYYTPLATP